MKKQEPDVIAQPATRPQDALYDMPMSNEAMNVGMTDIPSFPDELDDSTPPLAARFGQPQPETTYLPGAGLNYSSGDTFGYEMVAMGLEEPLPPQDVIDDL